MERYRDLNGDSNVLAYEMGNDYIKIKFEDSTVYLYTYASAGSQNIEEMKRLAIKGGGLNGFINKYVRRKYASKLI